MTIFITLFLIVLFLGMPIAFAMGVPSLAYIFASGNSMIMAIIPQKIFGGLNSFTLLAVPFFLFAGEIMATCGITDRLAKLCDLLVGRLRGGLAYVNVLNSTIFAGISGSAITDIMSMGALEIRMMKDQGYPEDFATACTVSSSVVGPIIPPSIMAAMYSGITGCSMGALFAAGYIPGILMSLAMCIVIFYQSRKHNFPKRVVKYSAKEVRKILIDGIAAVLMPVLMIGGILLGVFTPTEAAIVGVVYAIIVGLVFLRTLKLRDFPRMLKNTAKNSCALLLLLGVAYLFGWVLTYENISGSLAAAITSFTQSPTVFLLLVAALALFAGMWMEVGTIVIIFAPILYPVAMSLGISAIHFGIVLILCAALGVTTPPVGVCLYAASSIAGISAERTFRRVWPFLVAQIVTIIVMICLPELVLWLPRLSGFI